MTPATTPRPSQYHPQSDGIDTAVHGIEIRDAFVLGAPIGSRCRPASPPGSSSPCTTRASPDQLTGVTAPGAAKSVTLPAGGISLAASRPVYLTGPQPKIVLTGLTRPLAERAGRSVSSLDFLNAGASR